MPANNNIVATADITNPLEIPVYNPGGTAYVATRFYTWASPFHTTPIGLDGQRPDSYFTGLTAAVFSDEIHKYTSPICQAVVTRQSESYKASMNNYSTNTYSSNVARNYVLTGLTGAFGESSVADWTNQLTGTREQDLGKILAWQAEMHTRYYNHRGMTGCYIPAVMLLNMFRPYAEYTDTTPTTLAAGAITSGGPTASWLAVWHHPSDVLTMAGGTFAIGVTDASNISKSSIYCQAGLSGAMYGVNKIFESMKNELDRRIPYTPGLTYPQFINSDNEYFPTQVIGSQAVAEQTYVSTVTLGLTGVTAGSFTGYNIYTTPVWPFSPLTGNLDATRSYPLAIRKYTYSGGTTGSLQVVKLNTGTSSTWTGKTGYIGLTSSSGTYAITDASTAVNYTRNLGGVDVTYINISSPYLFVNIPSSYTGPLGAAVTGQTHDAGYWPQLINDPRASTYQFFDKITLKDLWGRTGPFNHSTTSGCNYSPNQYRPAQFIGAATPSNDPTNPGGITLDVANIRYTAHDPGQSSEDINPTFKNWLTSFHNAHTYWLMSKIYGEAKNYFPNIKILGEYDYMLGSKQYPCNRGKVPSLTYEIDLMSGYTGSSYTPNDAVSIFPPNLDGVSSLLGFNYFDSTSLNREAQQFFGLAAGNTPVEQTANRSGWVGSGFGPSGPTSSGLTGADGWFDKKTYRTFLEKCYQAGITGVSGGFNLTGTYSVNTGVAGYATPFGDSFLNQQDYTKARLYYSLKQVQQMSNNMAYFDEMSNRTLYICPWLTEPETAGYGSQTGNGYTLSSTTPTQNPWPREAIQVSTSYPLFQMLYQNGTARGATAIMHRPSEYDYFTFIRRSVWENGAGPFFVFDARGLIHKPQYTNYGVAGATGISGAIKLLLQKDIYTHVPVNTYQPELNFIGTPDSYGKNPVYAFFDSNIQSGESPLTVVFDSSDSWNPGGTATWYFHGTLTGPSGQGVTASYQYVGAGSYNVRLDIDNGYDTDTLTKTNYIVVSSEGVTGTANVEGDPLSGYAPLTVTFTDVSTIDPTDYATTYRSLVIDFGDGSTASMLSGQTIVSLTHAYESSGFYSISYSMVWNSGLTSSISKSNYITVYEVPSPTGSTSQERPGNTGDPGTNSLNYNFINNPKRVRDAKGKLVTNNGKLDIIR
jgi:PKD repeat protein